jgi:tRNA threonylcarbamoyladenosine biosynthesis protein TsaB
MKFLAIDTANEYMCVLAYKDGKTAKAFLPDCSMRHSTELMGQVEKALTECGLTLDECDFFAAVVGAGSFTGIRIGVSAAKGFCLATGKPSLPITSFEVAAYNALERGEKTLCVVDALHDAYYACGFDGENRVILPPAYLTEDEVLSLVDEGYALRALHSKEEWTIGLAERAKVQPCDPAEGLKNAVLAKAAAGAFGELNAVYVRKSSAELNLGK